MSSNQGQRALGLAAVLGIAAAAVGYFGLNGIATRAAARATGDFRDVVVTTADMTFGVKLEPTMLHLVKYPKDAVPAGAYSSMDSVVGQTTKVFMGAREPVTGTKLSSRGGGLSMLIRPSMRAASLEVNAVSGVSGFVLPGDRVDVLVTINTATNNPISRTLLQNIEVLAAGQKTQQKDGTPLTVQSVTLLVTPDDAEKLALAERQGEIHLVLRNPEDQEEVKVSGYTISQLLGGAAPAPAPSGTHPWRPAVVPPEPRGNVDPGKIRIIRSAQVTESPAIPDSGGH